ncbi:hypothetical protein V7266_30640 [Neobacillus drentensis]
MFNQGLHDSISAIQQKQHEDKQWKEELLSVLKSIYEKLDKLV